MNFKANKGFTMLEMMIVVFVFITGVVGVYGVILNFYKTAVFSSNRFTAMYLSQEAIELVRNIRDKNILNNAADWQSNITSVCTTGSTCKIDYNDTALSLGSDFLLKDPATGLYRYNNGSDTGGTATIFRRKIKITSYSSPTDYINILVRTEWYKSGTNTVEGYVEVEDNLYGYWGG